MTPGRQCRQKNCREPHHEPKHHSNAARRRQVWQYGGRMTPPERIHGWQDSQLSIARFYGGITYQGHTYTIAVAEKGAPLVRSDVLAREAKERKAADKAAKAQAAKQQEQLI